MEDLPPFSGPCPACRKCGLPKGKAVGSAYRYGKEDDQEFMERTCGQCGYTWRERCADEDWVQCHRCQGCAHPPLLGAEPLCDSCQEDEIWSRRYSDGVV